MRVFVAGATGAIGRRLLPLLVAAGHQVAGLTRKSERRAAIEAAGAEAVVGDALDAAWLRDAVVGARPEVVIHQLTDIPPKIDPRHYETQFAGNDRLRVEGTRNLVRAAAAAGARRVVAQSIAFAYRPEGSRVKDEDAPLYLDAPPPFRRSVEAVHALEQAVLAHGRGGVVLRYGYFYGPGTAYARDGALAGLVRKRLLPIIGSGDGVYSFIDIDDAAAATVAAVERGDPGIYNITDDTPAPVRDWLPAYAEALGAPKPLHVPALVARMVAGAMAVYAMTEQRGAANARARKALAWAPRYPSFRDGLHAI